MTKMWLTDSYPMFHRTVTLWVNIQLLLELTFIKNLREKGRGSTCDRYKTIFLLQHHWVPTRQLTDHRCLIAPLSFRPWGQIVANRRKASIQEISDKYQLDCNLDSFFSIISRYFTQCHFRIMKSIFKASPMCIQSLKMAVSPH